MLLNGAFALEVRVVSRTVSRDRDVEARYESPALYTSKRAGHRLVDIRGVGDARLVRVFKYRNSGWVENSCSRAAGHVGSG